MTINRLIEPDGSINDHIYITKTESDAIDHCHEILKIRFIERGELYTEVQRERCEWWLQGILRYDGVKQMICAAKNAMFH